MASSEPQAVKQHKAITEAWKAGHIKTDDYRAYNETQKLNELPKPTERRLLAGLKESSRKGSTPAFMQPSKQTIQRQAERSARMPQSPASEPAATKGAPKKAMPKAKSGNYAGRGNQKFNRGRGASTGTTSLKPPPSRVSDKQGSSSTTEETVNQGKGRPTPSQPQGKKTKNKSQTGTQKRRAQQRRNTTAKSQRAAENASKSEADLSTQQENVRKANAQSASKQPESPPVANNKAGKAKGTATGSGRAVKSGGTVTTKSGAKGARPKATPSTPTNLGNVNQTTGTATASPTNVEPADTTTGKPRTLTEQVFAGKGNTPKPADRKISSQTEGMFDKTPSEWQKYHLRKAGFSDAVIDKMPKDGKDGFGSLSSRARAGHLSENAVARVENNYGGVSGTGESRTPTRSTTAKEVQDRRAANLNLEKPAGKQRGPKAPPGTKTRGTTGASEQIFGGKAKGGRKAKADTATTTNVESITKPQLARVERLGLKGFEGMSLEQAKPLLGMPGAPGVTKAQAAGNLTEYFQDPNRVAATRLSDLAPLTPAQAIASGGAQNPLARGGKGILPNVDPTDWYNKHVLNIDPALANTTSTASPNAASVGTPKAPSAAPAGASAATKAAATGASPIDMGPVQGANVAGAAPASTGLASPIAQAAASVANPTRALPLEGAVTSGARSMLSEAPAAIAPQAAKATGLRGLLGMAPKGAATAAEGAGLLGATGGLGSIVPGLGMGWMAQQAASAGMNALDTNDTDSWWGGLAKEVAPMAAGGAVAGTLVPGWGTGIGALVGGGLGLGKYLLGGGPDTTPDYTDENQLVDFAQMRDILRGSGTDPSLINQLGGQWTLQRAALGEDATDEELRALRAQMYGLGGNVLGTPTPMPPISMEQLMQASQMGTENIGPYVSQMAPEKQGDMMLTMQGLPAQMMAAAAPYYQPPNQLSSFMQNMGGGAMGGIDPTALAALGGGAM